MTLIVMEIIFLFLAVWWIFTNVGRIIYKQDIPATNIFLMAVGIVGFIVLHFGLYK